VAGSCEHGTKPLGSIDEIQTKYETHHVYTYMAHFFTASRLETSEYILKYDTIMASKSVNVVLCNLQLSDVVVCVPPTPFIRHISRVTSRILLPTPISPMSHQGATVHGMGSSLRLMTNEFRVDQVNRNHFTQNGFKSQPSSLTPLE
jgi:hypothetical protein